MPKIKLLNIVLIVVLVLLVPYLIGRITVVVLEATYPSTPTPAADNSNARGVPLQERIAKLKEDAEASKKSLERARAITRTALVAIGVYYVVLIVGWIILRRRKRKLLPA